MKYKKLVYLIFVVSFSSHCFDEDRRLAELGRSIFCTANNTLEKNLLELGGRLMGNSDIRSAMEGSGGEVTINPTREEGLLISLCLFQCSAENNLRNQEKICCMALHEFEKRRVDGLPVS